MRKILYLLFAISGFSGLIYESIWSQYLKLFLGHAAYAQTLVLAIYMGGMALGSFIPSRYGTRWKNLLVWYAVIEAVIGICALSFHGLFVFITDYAYDGIIPSLSSQWSVMFFKWTTSAIMILPQSVLLGMTFPLMSAGLIRRCPDNPGMSIAMLYFTNSLGAAVGVLVSGFVMIGLMGLPGTIFTAGLINIGLAIIVWFLARRTPEPSVNDPAVTSARATDTATWRLMLAVSLLTGTASFIYEIGWIRMLSLVLGSSTHAFELMLSAFIFGLAFGGFWIRRRIDGFNRPVQFLGWIQIIMGLLALGSLVAYNNSMDLMKLFLDALKPTDSGYVLFNLASHGISLLIMVPVTFCAGMTLPLITQTLLHKGYGEKSIGAVYAANTTGAIAGVFFAVHLGMPILGLKGLIISGAALDMLLGVILLRSLSEPGYRRIAHVALLLAVLVVTVISTGFELDRYKMASGIYRTRKFLNPESIEFLYHKDGKTATVDLYKIAKNNRITIATNGKSDATVNMDPDKGGTTADEPTMILLGVVPILYNPKAETAANIGIGSGMTTNAILGSRKLERVDTIEIEPSMVEAAHGFLPRNKRTFNDPRSHIYIDDAKTFFSAHHNSYDVIISEPSNPWVSGVASLFSDEFYHRAVTYLNPEGLFVQWLQLYEINLELFASVMKAIARNFSDYVLYTTSDYDLLIVATNDGKMPQINQDDVIQKQLAHSLDYINIRTLQDLKLRRLGGRALFEPLFNSIQVPVNSDYYPVLDLNAVRTRFMLSDASEITAVKTTGLPLLDMLEGKTLEKQESRPTPSRNLAISRAANSAWDIYDYYTAGNFQSDVVISRELLVDILLVREIATDCEEDIRASLWLDSVTNIIKAVIPYLDTSKTETLWRKFHSSGCFTRLSPVQRDFFMLLGAVARHDAARMAALADELLAGSGLTYLQRHYLLAAGMLGNLANNNPKKSIRLWNKYSPQVTTGTGPPNIIYHLLLAHSIGVGPR